ncbi:hypothetical protein [Paenibacillus polymyxa]|uniref:hypothetical protein n=1 Tax=Paenibacillus polymyxa TaxID=1406 RepID=UPI001C9E1753|nr:hypothetical protein [Paenibacillus polymyxa]MBY7740128.1 hypothetical protein [Paenibacillus polymyxa]
MQNKNIKRLTPTPETIRKLYLLSGNECAFPKCNARMIDGNGNFIGQVCHIEAAMPGGERFNPKQTNEDRREFSNLMLMCYEHHIVTNDVSNYTVKKLKNIKKNHEEKYLSAVNNILNSVTDKTKSNKFTYANSCTKLVNAWGWNLSVEEQKALVDDLNETLNNSLNKLPQETRELLVVMIERCREQKVYLHEISKVTGISLSKMKEDIDLLIRYKIIDEPESDDYSNYYITFKLIKKEWEFWDDLNDTCNNCNISLEELIIGLDFSLLD